MTKRRGLSAFLALPYAERAEAVHTLNDRERREARRHHYRATAVEVRTFPCSPTVSRSTLGSRDLNVTLDDGTLSEMARGAEAAARAL